jgi:hypothetical protein
MKNKLIFILFLIVVVPSGFAQLKTYSFQEAEKLSAENQSPLLFLFILPGVNTVR